MIASGLRRVRFLMVMMPLLAAACATPETGSGPVASADAEQRDKTLVVADAAYEGGRYSEALAEYTRLLEIDPRDEAARLGVADCYMAAGGAKQASAIYAMESLQGRAERLQHYNHFLGDPGKLSWDLDRYRKVTQDAVRATVARYLVDDRRVVLVTTPAEGGAK